VTDYRRYFVPGGICFFTAFRRYVKLGVYPREWGDVHEVDAGGYGEWLMGYAALHPSYAGYYCRFSTNSPAPASAGEGKG